MGEGLFYLEQVVILDPTMNTSRDMESNNDVDMRSPQKNPFKTPEKSGISLTNRKHSASFTEFMEKTVLHHFRVKGGTDATEIPYWNENETVGDGNCFYNAIMDQIQNNPGVRDTLSDDAKQCSTPSELRAAVIRFIESWPPALNRVETMNVWKTAVYGDNWKHYLDQQRKPGVFADDIVIHSTATFLGKDIYVTTNQNKVIWKLENSHAGTNGTPITLASNQSSEKGNNGQPKTGGEHFQSLIPTARESATETCRNCFLPGIKRLKAHLNNSKINCKRMYDLALLEAEAKAKLQQKQKERSAKYRESNRESLKSKHREYNTQNKLQIREKQAEYDSQHRPQKRIQQAEYDSQHRQEKAEYYSQNRLQIREKQAEYDSLHKPQKRIQQAEYDSQHKQEKAEYYTQNRLQIMEKQAEYDSQHRPQKRIQQAEYDSQHKQEKAEYYTQNRLQIMGKQAEYDSQHKQEKAEYYTQNRLQIMEKQAEYDSQHRPQKRKQVAEYYSHHTPEKLRKQAEYDSQHRAQKNLYDSVHRPEKSAAVTALRNYRNKNQDLAGRLKEFRGSQRDGLSYTCASCCRLWFKSSVVDVTSKRSTMSPEILEPLKRNHNDKLPSTYLCGTCKKYLKADKLPPLAAKNGLSIEPMPDSLNLSELEAVLCSRNIIFAKIHSLPRNWCLGSKDKVVNVPINSDDLRNTLDKITTFPRQPLEGGLLPVSEKGISVKLKRKQSFKGHHLHKTINPEKVVKATQYFKEIGHPMYQDIHIDTNYTPTFPSDQQEPDMESETISIDKTNNGHENNFDMETSCDSWFVKSFDDNLTLQDAPRDQDSDEDDDRLEAVKSNQFEQSQHYVMADDHPEQRCLTSSSKSIKDLHLAPGEGKIPSSLMRDDTWDIGGFPNLHPSGNFGLHHERPLKISHQKYFIQRLQNINPQFRNSKPYLFAATYFMERHQFEQRINLSCQRGTIDKGEFNENKDPMNVFDQVKGTPKYWQKKRREMVAKIAQLGPFQFFFTLSCADKRWPENFISILTQKGHTVTFEKAGSTDHMHDDPVMALIDGKPMEEVLKSEYPDLHKLFRENIYTITKVFDKRVQNFIKHIVFGKNAPMKARHYQYRIEFQSRGAGHGHGVLWLDLKDLDSDFPGIQDIFKNIKNNNNFNDTQLYTLCGFIDRFISCSLQDENVSHIVKQVQIHNHSKTCRKYGSKCRFGFPRYPSEYTIVAQPLVQEDFPTKEDLDKHQKMLQSVLEKVKILLEDMEVRKKNDKLFAQHLFEKITIEDILIHAKIAEDLWTSEILYYEALGVTKKGKMIILKRTVQEMWVNNYNPEWLLAWNGNMDIQLCLDFFAICTYITDYYTKDETGTLTHLIKAVKECHGKGQKETMRALANEFSSHRQVGESEAYYKLFPELHLTHSSVKTGFLAGGVPNERSVFLRKVRPQGDADSEQEDDIETEINPKVSKCNSKKGKSNIKTEDTILIGDNEYVRPPSIHDKYAARPDSLEHICLAQFFIWYEPVPKASKNRKKEAESLSEHEIICPHLESPLYLPNYIQLKNPALGCMYLREGPQILMYHKFDAGKDAHKFFYTELLFYFHWRREAVELHSEDFTACLAKFKKEFTVIEKVKTQMFPEMNNVELARTIMEEYPEDIRPSHIGDLIDNQNEQDEAEQQFEGEQPDPEYEVRGYDGNFGCENASEQSIFKMADLSRRDEMLQRVRQLAPEQRHSFNEIIGYAKELRKYTNAGGPKPKAPLIIVHGGAGSGKSELIKVASFWFEFLLTTNDEREPNNPFVIRCAQTGMAAHNIDGLTLCSSFKIWYKNSHVGLSDNERDKFQRMLTHLQLVIIDEMSMVKSDQLYQIDSRLQEYKSNPNFFGGVAVLLVGDLMQLQPVMGRWIFDRPRDDSWQNSFEWNNLWGLFTPYVLEINHRQGENKEYADILNRLRIGEHTKEDIAKLKTRVVSDMQNEVPADALVIFGKKQIVNAYNEKMLNKLGGNAEVISANHINPLQKNFHARVNPKTGEIADTQFLDTLMVKIGARVMLIHNVMTIDGLTNGACGEIVAIEKSKEKIETIIIQFDNLEAGMQMRRNNPRITKQYGENATPIRRVSLEYSNSTLSKEHTAKVKLIQFPIRLAWAITAHKIQGQTIKHPRPVGIDINSTFGQGQASQAYVMLGRTENLQQLYMSDFDEKKLEIDPDGPIQEARDLKRRAELNIASNKWISTSETTLKIAGLNVRSLKCHFKDVIEDSFLLKSDILAFSETWFPKQNFQAPELQGYQGHHIMSGRGGGVSLYIREELRLLSSPVNINLDHLQIIKAEFSTFTLIVVYRSPSRNSHLELANLLSRLIPSKGSVMIIGDINIHPKEKIDHYTRFNERMATKGFSQIIDRPTHKDGHILDHVYVRDVAIADWRLHHPYYSDHDAICVRANL